MAFLRNKKCKGIDYYVMVENRRVDGKVKQYTLETIGTWDKVMERFSSFWNKEYSKSASAESTFEAFIHGAPYALYRMAEKLGMEIILDTLLPQRQRNGIKRSTSLILAAIHRACDPGSKNAFSDWFKKTSLPYHLKIDPFCMTSQHFWEQMDDLSQEEIEKAEDAITEKIAGMFSEELDFLSLDYTNYYTFIDSNNTRNDICRRGHNKQKRNDLRQFSLAIITTKATGIPLVAHMYEGNDQTEFPVFVEMIKKRFPFYNPERMTLIFDGGSNTKNNLNQLESHFLCSFSLSNAKELLDIDIDDYYDIQLEKTSVRGYRKDTKIWGIKRRCVLTESAALCKGQKAELDRNIEKFKTEIRQLESQIANPRARIRKDAASLQKKAEAFIKGKKHLKEFITISAEDSKVSYVIDEQKREEIERKWFGKKLTITDHLDWSEKEILEAYYSQECVEKVFRDTKDTEHFSLRPVYHWTDQKIRVHVFICLLSLLLGQMLMKEMERNGIKISKDKMIDELNGIYDGWIIKSAANRKMNFTRVIGKMTEEQKMLWNVVLKMDQYAPHKTS